MQSNEWTDVLSRQWPAFLITTCAGLLLTLFVVAFYPRRYQSEVKLLLRLGRENVSLDPTATMAGEPLTIHQSRDNEVNTTLQAMQSRSIIEQVVDRIGAKPVLEGCLTGRTKLTGSAGSLVDRLKAVVSSIDPIEDREKAVITLQEGLKISAARDTSVVTIAYRTKSPEFAQAVVNEWTEAFREQHMRMNTTDGSLKFFQEQEAEIITELNASRDRLNHAKSKYGLVTIEGEQAILEKQIEWARSLRMESEARLAGAHAKLNELEKLRGETSESIVTNEVSVDNNDAQARMRDRLYGLEMEERRLASSYTPDHPVMAAVKQQTDEARRVLLEVKPGEQQITKGVNPAHTSLQELRSLAMAECRQLEAEVNAATEAGKKLREDLQKLNEFEVTIAAMQREVGILEERYRVQCEKQEQARLAERLQLSRISNVNVIQPASLEHRPVTPQKVLCVFLGTMASLLTAFGLAFVRESRPATVTAKHLVRSQVGTVTGKTAEGAMKIGESEFKLGSITLGSGGSS